MLALAAAAGVAACTELRTAPPDGLGGSGGGAAGTGAAGTGGSSGGGTGGTGGTGPTLACDSTLIGWWRLNEASGATTADHSASDDCVPNGQTGMLVGGATWAAGREGAGISLDGTSGLVSVQPFDGSALWNYPVVPFTMMAWIRPDAAAVSAASATAVARTHEDYAFQNFWLGLVGGNPRCVVHHPGGEGATVLAKVAADTWTHLACTYALSGEVRVYVNGTLAATYTAAENLGPIPTRILIGASEIQNPNLTVLGYFAGRIDDVRIWNRPLDAGEVAAIASP
jgi:hypothetical protein